MHPSLDKDLGNYLDHPLVTESDILMALRQIEVRRVEDLCIVNVGWNNWLRREGDGRGLAPLYFSYLVQRLPWTRLLRTKALYTRFQ